MNKQDHQITGRLHSIESMGLVDGPGIRTIFFLQGCPLRCLYCHNPDTQNPEGGKIVTPSDILKLAKRYKPYQGDDGGVTFSGGEPLIHGEFLAESVKLLKENDFNICIDTSGYGQKKYYKEIFPYVDTILLDIKAFSEQAYLDMCSVQQKPLNDFMNELENYGFHGQIWVRHVMVPGYTDNKKSMQELIKTIEPIQHLVERLEILPYHTMGIDKYKELNMPYLLENVEPMDKEKAKEFEVYANVLLAEQMSKDRIDLKEKQDVGSSALESNVSLEEHNKIIGSFSNLPLLQHINSDILADIQHNLVVKKLEKDEILFQSGDDPNYMYIIYAGAIKIFNILPNLKEQIFYIYRKDSFVGGHNLLSDSKYWYTGEALMDSIVIAIPAKIFNTYFANKKSVLKEILSQSFERIRWAEDLINRLATINSSVKTAGLILRLAENFGIKKNDQIQIPMKFDRAEMSNFSGLTRDSLTRKLGEFEELGYIRIENEILTILNFDALESYLD
ncbi:MAG TPA: pyruvate formate lyase-activating protein [Clostridiaceae bacterium]|nr:pyruvate formate lyase-activating protein [Clostridiaceae bacterium]